MFAGQASAVEKVKIGGFELNNGFNGDNSGFGWFDETGQEVDQGSLTRAIGTDDSQDVTLVEGEAYIHNRLHTAERLAYAPNIQQNIRLHGQTFSQRSN